MDNQQVEHSETHQEALLNQATKKSDHLIHFFLIGYYVDIGRCDKAEALRVSIEKGGANRPTTVNGRPSLAARWLRS